MALTENSEHPTEGINTCSMRKTRGRNVRLAIHQWNWRRLSRACGASCERLLAHNAKGFSGTSLKVLWPRLEKLKWSVRGIFRRKLPLVGDDIDQLGSAVWMAARTGYVHGHPKVTGQIKFISCIYNPTPLYGRESQPPNRRWKALQLNPVRRTPLGRVFWSRIRHGFYGSFPARNSISAGVGHHSGRPRPNHRLRRALQVSLQTPCFWPMDDLLLQCDARGDDDGR